MRRAMIGGFAALLVALALVSGADHQANANGVPQLVKLTYLDGVSNFGPKDAEGVLEKNEEGRLAVTRTTLRPKVTFGEGVRVDAEALRKLHESAHRGCFIAASVKTVVTVET